MKSNYKPRYARCFLRSIDNPVEPGQVMSVQDMLIAFTRGQDLPDKIGEYDEGITIDEVGYLVGDRLDAVDYMNSVNQRNALQKMNEAKNAPEISTETPVETPVSNE